MAPRSPPRPTPPKRRPRPPPIYVYERRSAGRSVYFLSLLAPDDVVAAGGLHRAAVMGTNASAVTLSTDSFLPNPLFLDLVHEVVAAVAHRVPPVARAAWFQRSGEMAIWDGRNLHRRETDEAEDVLGHVAVRDGAIVEGTYAANPDYTPISARGLFRLPELVFEALMERLRALRVPLVRLGGEH
ncbi:MAG: hypothetical protein H6739_15585 [Alphaproteobacteria bacterium]|nr:hypothetical protein [Alphaproteobacteria bacterium]